MDQRTKRKIGLLLYLSFVLVFLAGYLATVAYQIAHHVPKPIVVGGKS